MVEYELFGVAGVNSSNERINRVVEEFASHSTNGKIGHAFALFAQFCNPSPERLTKNAYFRFERKE